MSKSEDKYYLLECDDPKKKSKSYYIPIDQPKRAYELYYKNKKEYESVELAYVNMRGTSFYINLEKIPDTIDECYE